MSLHLNNLSYFLKCFISNYSNFPHNSDRLFFSEQEPPPSMLHLHNIADKEEGWIQVVNSMINVIPLLEPLGPSVITLLLDDCPLPSKESVFKVMYFLAY